MKNDFGKKAMADTIKSLTDIEPLGTHIYELYEKNIPFLLNWWDDLSAEHEQRRMELIKDEENVELLEILSRVFFTAGYCIAKQEINNNGKDISRKTKRGTSKS